MSIAGFLNINKPCNMTSYDVIRILKRYTGKQKIGHAGILDRPAVGVLPIGIGYATKLFEYFNIFSKTYAGIIALGLSTTTDDATGELIKLGDTSKVSLQTIQREANQWLGEKLQFPPLFSSIKLEGKELYRYALADQPVAVKPRKVVFYQISVDNLHNFGELEEKWSYTLDNISPTVKAQLPKCVFCEFIVTCCSGTYMRSFARDLGAALNTQGMLFYLNRTRVGAFELKDAIDINQLVNQLNQGFEIKKFLAPCSCALDMHNSIVLGNAEINHLFNGRYLDIAIERWRINSTELSPFIDNFSIPSEFIWGVDMHEQLICVLKVLRQDTNTGVMRIKLDKRLI